jgi:hypothetical protein
LPGSLQLLLQSLQAQTMPHWTALLLVLDSTPFEGLSRIVAGANDARIRLFAEWVGPQQVPKQDDGSWNATYMRQLYTLTDHAIRGKHSRVMH